MKTSHAVGISVLGLIVGAVIAIVFVRQSGGPALAGGSPHRLVSISGVNVGASNPCEVDYPVALLRITKKHTIAWYAQDHDFWIKFVNGTPIGSVKIYVAKGQTTTDYGIQNAEENYYMYAIYDSDPDGKPTPTPCKAADDDRDTGLNVKR